VLAIAVSEITRNVREVTSAINSVKPVRLTEADRASLRTMLDELSELIATAQRLE